MKMRPLQPLGAPARVRVTKVIRTSWRIGWEYDGTRLMGDEDGVFRESVRRRRTRYMQSTQLVAYRAAAMRLIFGRRDRYSKGMDDGGRSTGCKLCDSSPVNRSREDPQACRYHDCDSVEALRNRLARYLLWRDSRGGAR